MRLAAWLAVRRVELWTFAIVGGSVATLVGLWIAGLALLETSRALEREDWPVAQGVVLAVEHHTDRTVNGQPADSRVATYAWTLDGRRIVAEQSLSIPTLPFTFGLREDTLRSIRTGAVRVHYNPDNPSESWIIAETPQVESAILGLAYALMGLSIAVAGWFKRRGAELLLSEGRGSHALDREPPGPKRWTIRVVGVC